MGNYATALSLIDSSLAKYPGTPFAWAHKGFIQTRLKKYDGALSSYNVSIGILERYDFSHAEDYMMPEYANIYRQRAEVREELGDTAGARRDRRMAKKFDAEGPKPFLWQRLLL
jgi:tetratricopeptide (TPR) repeat protein